ncbi:hypothetical protein [Blastococcus montanus]|uniref:hypothetical protein n=1 Tax=Blastococcus montanus TaxID=3144973 RepID=UPI003209058B
MTDRETSTLLGELADRVPVGPAPTSELLRAGRRARRRRTAGAALAVAAGVAVAVGGVVTFVQPFDGAEPAPMVVAEEPQPDAPELPGGTGPADPLAGSSMAPLPENPTADRTGPLADGAAASCAVAYSPDAVRDRDFAFDGVVLGIGPSVTDRSDTPGPALVGVTFAVQEWFFGGDGATVTVDLPPPATDGASSSVDGPVYGTGSRLLVSGESRWDGAPLEEPIAWMCGFTRYYDEETAAAWR